MDEEPTKQRGSAAKRSEPGMPGGTDGAASPVDPAVDLSSPWPRELFDDCESISVDLYLEEDVLPGLWRHAWIPGRSPNS
jgi:hypothetical protein